MSQTHYSTDPFVSTRRRVRFAVTRATPPHLFAKDEPIGGGERRRFTREVFEPAEMGRAPVGTVAKHKAAPGEEFENVVTRREDLALKCFAAADHIAHALLGLQA